MIWWLAVLLLRRTDANLSVNVAPVIRFAIMWTQFKCYLVIIEVFEPALRLKYGKETFNPRRKGRGSEGRESREDQKNWLRRQVYKIMCKLCGRGTIKPTNGLKQYCQNTFVE